MANEILWTLVNTLIRVTALRFTTRVFIFSPHPRDSSQFILRAFVYVILMECVVHGIATVLTTCLICRPMAAAWNGGTDGICGDQVVAYVVLEAVGALIDLTILLIAPSIIWGTLRLSWHCKINLTCLLSAGALYDFTLHRAYKERLQSR